MDAHISVLTEVDGLKPCGSTSSSVSVMNEDGAFDISKESRFPILKDFFIFVLVVAADHSAGAKESAVAGSRGWSNGVCSIDGSS